MIPAYIPVSLGDSCEAKFQVSRVMQYRKASDFSPAAFRLMMLPPHRSADRFGWSICEWQTTPLTALCDYIERDFQGIFEREDLTIGSSGCAFNTRFRTEHLHEFEKVAPPGEDLTEAHLDLGYAEARSAIDERASALRQILNSPGPYLYILCGEAFPNAASVKRLIGLLRRYRDDHQFHLLFVASDEEGLESHDLAAFEGLVSKAFRPSEFSKPGDRDWEGDDEAWNVALAPFRLAFTDGDIVEAQPGILETSSSNMIAVARRVAVQTWSYEQGMSWQEFPTEWRGLTVGYELERATLPLEFVTPALAWDYAAITRVLPRPAEETGPIVLRVALRCTRGRVGVCITRTNCSAIVGGKVAVTPEDGDSYVYLAFRPGRLPMSILILNYDCQDVECAVRVERVDAQPLAQLDPELRAKVAAFDE